MTVNHFHISLFRAHYHIYVTENRAMESSNISCFPDIVLVYRSITMFVPYWPSILSMTTYVITHSLSNSLSWISVSVWFDVSVLVMCSWSYFPMRNKTPSSYENIFHILFNWHPWCLSREFGRMASIILRHIFLPTLLPPRRSIHWYHCVILPSILTKLSKVTGALV